MTLRLWETFAWTIWFTPHIVSVLLCVAAVHQWRSPRLRWVIPTAELYVCVFVGLIWRDVGQYVFLAPAIASAAALVGTVLHNHGRRHRRGFPRAHHDDGHS